MDCIGPQIQQLAELEEIMLYKVASEDKRSFIRQMWSKRLVVCTVHK